jgi:hypothetical protein
MGKDDFFLFISSTYFIDSLGSPLHIKPRVFPSRSLNGVASETIDSFGSVVHEEKTVVKEIYRVKVYPKLSIVWVSRRKKTVVKEIDPGRRNLDARRKKTVDIGTSKRFI